jgi:hypothetical protein
MKGFRWSLGREAESAESLIRKKVCDETVLVVNLVRKLLRVVNFTISFVVDLMTLHASW